MDLKQCISSPFLTLDFSLSIVVELLFSSLSTIGIADLWPGLALNSYLRQVVLIILFLRNFSMISVVKQHHFFSLLGLGCSRHDSASALSPAPVDEGDECTEPKRGGSS